jgi:hypothetical protein
MMYSAHDSVRLNQYLINALSQVCTLDAIQLLLEG